MIDDPLRGVRRKLPEIQGLHTPCPSLRAGICQKDMFYDDAIVVQTNFTTVCTLLSRWKCIGSTWKIVLIYRHGDPKRFIISVCDVWNQSPRSQWLGLHDLRGEPDSLECCGRWQKIVPSLSVFKAFFCNGTRPVRISITRVHLKIPKLVMSSKSASVLRDWGREQWHTVTTRADDTDAYPDSLYPKMVAKSWRKKRTPTASASIVTTPEVLRELGVDNQNEKAKADCLAKWRAALGKKDLFMRQKLDNIKKSFARAGWTVDAPQAASAASTRAPDDSEDDGIVSMDDASNGVASDGDFDEDENAVYRRGGPAPARPPSVPGPPRPASPPPAQPPPQQPRSAPPVPAETALGPQPASPAVRLASQPSGSGVPAGPASSTPRPSDVPPPPAGPPVQRGPRRRAGNWLYVTVYRDGAAIGEIAADMADTGVSIDAHCFCATHQFTAGSRPIKCHCDRRRTRGKRPGQGNPMGFLGAWLLYGLRDDMREQYQHNEFKKMLGHAQFHELRREGRQFLWDQADGNIARIFELEADWQPSVRVEEPLLVP